MFPQGATCAVHASAAANRTCKRCGAFACELCQENPFHPGTCPSCATRLAEPASTRSYLSVVFAGLSIGCYCLPLGIVAAILGHLEVEAIDRGESPLSGRSYANAGRWIGVVTGSLSIILGVVFGMAALLGAMNER